MNINNNLIQMTKPSDSKKKKKKKKKKVKKNVPHSRLCCPERHRSKI